MRKKDEEKHKTFHSPCLKTNTLLSLTLIKVGVLIPIGGININFYINRQKIFG
jgi:hypothetical protein